MDLMFQNTGRKIDMSVEVLMENGIADILLRSIQTEMDRARDWPLRILAFTSVLHFGVLLAIVGSSISLLPYVKCGLSFMFLVLMCWTIFLFRKFHIDYLHQRQAQRRLQLKLDIDKEGIFPDEWLKERCVCLREKWWGMGYYIFIEASFFVSVLCVIWLPVKST